MSGKWLPPEEKPHHCDLPKIESMSVFSGHSAGDRWQCECGAIYVIASLYQHGESWNQWSRE